MQIAEDPLLQSTLLDLMLSLKSIWCSWNRVFGFYKKSHSWVILFFLLLIVTFHLNEGTTKMVLNAYSYILEKFLVLIQGTDKIWHIFSLIYIFWAKNWENTIEFDPK